MSLGAFAPLPLRLGGSPTEGWSSQAHARMCADLVAVKRVMPLAVFTFLKLGSAITIEAYYGQNGAGVAYAPDQIVIVGTGETTFLWSSRNFTDPYGIKHPIAIRGARATPSATDGTRGVVLINLYSFT